MTKNLQTITSEILGTGLTQMELALRVPCSQSAISAFVTGARGVETRYSIESRLREIHSELIFSATPRKSKPKSSHKPEL